MRFHVALLTLMASLLIGISDGAPQDPRRATTSSPETLPGRVVDVKAGEFFFRAPLSIPAGLTTFRRHQVGMVGERLRAGGRVQSVVRHDGDSTHGMH